MPAPTYKISQHPRDHMFYVMGACGDGMYMAVSEGFETMGPARDALRRYVGSDASAKAELRGGSLAVHA